MNENKYLTDNDLEIFISHPESHTAIADVVREAIEEWTSRNIMVHQTSNDRATPVLVGDTLRPALEEAIRRSHVLLLIYVRAELSEYCMFEAGAAGATSSRVVVFQCEEEIPRVFADDLIVKMTENSVRQFTYQFHKNENFFPGLGHELSPRADEKLIEHRSQNLYKSFQDALRRTGAVTPEPDKTFDRWISFTVSIDEPYVLEVFQLTTEVDRNKNQRADTLIVAEEKAREFIEKFCIIQEAPENLGQHFDLSEINFGRDKFVKLYQRWKNFLLRNDGEEFLGIEWWDDICRQIFRAIGKYKALEVEAPIKSVHEPATWYLPVVLSRTIRPSQKRHDFLISLVRLSRNRDWMELPAFPPVPSLEKDNGVGTQ